MVKVEKSLSDIHYKTKKEIVDILNYWHENHLGLRYWNNDGDMGKDIWWTINDSEGIVGTEHDIYNNKKSHKTEDDKIVSHYNISISFPSGCECCPPYFKYVSIPCELLDSENWLEAANNFLIILNNEFLEKQYDRITKKVDVLYKQYDELERREYQRMREFEKQQKLLIKLE